MRHPESHAVRTINSSESILLTAISRRNWSPGKECWFDDSSGQLSVESNVLLLTDSKSRLPPRRPPVACP